MPAPQGWCLDSVKICNLLQTYTQNLSITIISTVSKGNSKNKQGIIRIHDSWQPIQWFGGWHTYVCWQISIYPQPDQLTALNVTATSSLLLFSVYSWKIVPMICYNQLSFESTFYHKTGTCICIICSNYFTYTIAKGSS